MEIAEEYYLCLHAMKWIPCCKGIALKWSETGSMWNLNIITISSSYNYYRLLIECFSVNSSSVINNITRNQRISLSLSWMTSFTFSYYFQQVHHLAWFLNQLEWDHVIGGKAAIVKWIDYSSASRLVNAFKESRITKLNGKYWSMHWTPSNEFIH